ncbi:hypothetical protein EGW08_020449, partial [Elysia chlorotica]
NSVDETNCSHKEQEGHEEVRVAIKLELSWLREQNRADKLAFGSGPTCSQHNSLHLLVAIETCLDHMSPAEEHMARVVLEIKVWLLDIWIQTPGHTAWVWQGRLGDWNTLT